MGWITRLIQVFCFTNFKYFKNIVWIFSYIKILLVLNLGFLFFHKIEGKRKRTVVQNLITCSIKEIFLSMNVKPENSMMDGERNRDREFY